MPRTAPYGSWKSPITADLLVSNNVAHERILIDGDDVYWVETRPSERGRCVVVRRTGAGEISDITPSGFNSRTRVHEYGGGAYTVEQGAVYFSNFADQRLYRQTPGSKPEPLTPAGDVRYADYVIDRQRRRMICVREDHTDSRREAVNTLVSIPLDGGPGRTLVAGADFYATPRLHPGGARLAWLAWNHPDMPWGGTELWTGEIDATGRIGECRKVAGGREESIFQPAWSPDGVLHFVSDRSGWWNLYRWHAGRAEPLCEMEAEFGMPQWGLGHEHLWIRGPRPRRLRLHATRNMEARRAGHGARTVRRDRDRLLGHLLRCRGRRQGRLPGRVAHGGPGGGWRRCRQPGRRDPGPRRHGLRLPRITSPCRRR